MLWGIVFSRISRRDLRNVDQARVGVGGDTDSGLSRSRAISISICEGRELVCDVLLPGPGTYTAAPCDAVAGISEMWSDLALSSGPALKEDLTVSMHRFSDVYFLT